MPYKDPEKARQCSRESQRRRRLRLDVQQQEAEYRKTAARKESLTRYDRSDKGKAASNRWMKSEKGKACRKRAEQSEKGKAARARYVMSEKRRKVAREWARRNPETVAANVRKRRARLLSAETEPYSRQEIWERDKGICGLCDLPVDLVGSEIDHIVPLSKGGSDLRLNIHITHRTCNRRKSKGILRDYMPNVLTDEDIVRTA